MTPHSALPAKAQAARVFYYKALRRDNPNYPVAALWQSALAQVHFRATLAAQVADHKKRSASARRGWANRRASA